MVFAGKLTHDVETAEHVDEYVVVVNRINQLLDSIDDPETTALKYEAARPSFWLAVHEPQQIIIGTRIRRSSPAFGDFNRKRIKRA